MWEFMSKYAESFWAAGDSAWHVLSVCTAWAITLGFAYFTIIFIAALGEMVVDKIKEIRNKTQG